MAYVGQLYSDLHSRLEGATHAVWELFNEHNLEELFLIDASNAFNSVNGVAALWYARVLWPCCSRFLFNTTLLCTTITLLLCCCSMPVKDCSVGMLLPRELCFLSTFLKGFR